MVDNMQKLNVAQTNALCHWLCIPYDLNKNSLVEKRVRVCRTIMEKEVELLTHVWWVVLEHTPTETISRFDKQLNETEPPAPSKLEAMELRVLEHHALKEQIAH